MECVVEVDLTLIASIHRMEARGNYGVGCFILGGGSVIL